MIVVDVGSFARRNIVDPESDFVVVAAAVAVFGAVEDGRRGMRSKNAQRSIAHAHRDVPVAFRRKPQNLPNFRRIPILLCRSVWIVG